MADLAARPAGLDVGQPDRIRAGLGRGNNLDQIAIAQFGAQRRQILVDAGRRTVMADVGVHGVGEIDHRRPARQGHDLAFGREDIDLVGEEVDLDVFEELGGIVALHFEQGLQPLVRLDLEVGAALLDVLVQPVRRDALLGDVVHVAGTDLHFDRRAVGPD